jgi:hypothetical protein
MKLGGEKTKEKDEAEKTEVQGGTDQLEQREAEKSSLSTATRKVLQAATKELELIHVLRTERRKIRPIRTAVRRRVNEICERGKLKEMNQE